eukprot:TRINITY_DN1811_c1_g1_i2.p2 TRINITY_DN1811_c1_g1~~TRINITY_DN1811_c1_g1_i2.p2  ORF type:complete len:1133 (-),score=443.30 TRINITY_DN1811_c1_g1_i2:865-4263(-)
MTEFMATPVALDGTLGKPSRPEAHAFSLAQQSGSKLTDAGSSRDVLFAIDPTLEVRNAGGLTGEIAFDEPAEWVPSWDGTAQVEEAVAAEKALFIAGTPLSTSTRSSFSEGSDEDGPGNSSYPPEKVSPRNASPVTMASSPTLMRLKVSTPIKDGVIRDMGFLPPVDLKMMTSASPLKDKYAESAPSAMKAVAVSQMTLQASRSLDNLGKFFVTEPQAVSESKSIADIRFAMDTRSPGAEPRQRAMERSASGGARRQVSFMDDEANRGGFVDSRRRLEEERRLNFEDERRRMENERRLLEESTGNGAQVQNREQSSDFAWHEAMRQAVAERAKNDDDDRHRQAEARLMSAEADALVREVMTLGLGDESPSRKESREFRSHHQHSMPGKQMHMPAGGFPVAPPPSPQPHSNQAYMPSSPMQLPSQPIGPPQSPYGNAFSAARSPPRPTTQHNVSAAFVNSPVSQMPPYGQPQSPARPQLPTPQASPMRSIHRTVSSVAVSSPHWAPPGANAEQHLAPSSYPPQQHDHYAAQPPQQLPYPHNAPAPSPGNAAFRDADRPRDYLHAQPHDDNTLYPPAGRGMQRSASSPMYTHEFPPPVHGYSNDFAPPTTVNHQYQQPAHQQPAHHDFPQPSPSQPFAPPQDNYYQQQSGFGRERGELPRSMSFGGAASNIDDSIRPTDGVTGGHPLVTSSSTGAPQAAEIAEMYRRKRLEEMAAAGGSATNDGDRSAPVEHVPQAAEIAELYRQQRLQEAHESPGPQAAQIAEQYRLQRLDSRSADFSPSAAEVAERYRQKKREEEPAPLQAAEVAEQYRQRRLLEEQQAKLASPGGQDVYRDRQYPPGFNKGPRPPMPSHMNPHQMKQLRRRELEQQQAQRFPVDDRYGRYPPKKLEDRFDLLTDPTLMASDREAVQKLLEIKQQQLALQQQQLELERKLQDENLQRQREQLKLQQQLQDEEQRKRLDGAGLSSTAAPTRLTSEHRSSSALNPHAPGFEPSGLAVPSINIAPVDGEPVAVPPEVPTDGPVVGLSAVTAPPASNEAPLPPVYPPVPSRGFADAMPPPRGYEAPYRGHGGYGERGYGAYENAGRGYGDHYGGRGFGPRPHNGPEIRPNGSIAPPGYNGSRYSGPRGYSNAGYRR